MTVTKDYFTKDHLYQISVKNKTLFNCGGSPGLNNLELKTVNDFMSAGSFSYSQRQSRNSLKESKTLLDIIKQVEYAESAPTTLTCNKFGSSDLKKGVTGGNIYLFCTPFASNVIVNERWNLFSKTEVTNPEKDIVFKIWHLTGLSPRIAQAMGLYHSRDCPFCGKENIET